MPGIVGRPHWEKVSPCFAGWQGRDTPELARQGDEGAYPGQGRGHGPRYCAEPPAGMSGTRRRHRSCRCPAEQRTRPGQAFKRPCHHWARPSHATPRRTYNRARLLCKHAHAACMHACAHAQASCRAPTNVPCFARCCMRRSLSRALRKSTRKVSCRRAACRASSTCCAAPRLAPGCPVHHGGKQATLLLPHTIVAQSTASS